MTQRTPRPFLTVKPPRRRGVSARLWIACLLGAIATALASACVIAAVSMAGAALDAMMVMEAIGAACLLGLLVSMISAAWVTRGIVHGLREIEEGLSRGLLPESAPGAEWGELGDLARDVRNLLETNRELRRSELELQTLAVAIDYARDKVEHWIQTEHWEALAPGSGALSPLAESLDLGMLRASELDVQNLEAARLSYAELERVIEEARGTAEIAEHGYVEVTALLTTIREIARLTGEIQQAVLVPPEPSSPEPAAGTEWRDQAAHAIEELVEVSGASVQRLGEGLVRVREINEQVQLMSNRATLIALNAVVNSGRQETRQLSPETSSAELKQLAREVRSATERVTALSAEIDAAVAAANSTMKDARERVIARFSGIGAPQASRVVGPPVPALVTHWVERLREMVQDAARKGERMAESQERVSSAAQRVSRRIEEEAHDIEGLVARLTPMGATSEVPPAAPTRDRSDGDPAPSRTLRLLDPESRGPARTDDSTAEEEGGS